MILGHRWHPRCTCFPASQSSIGNYTRTAANLNTFRKTSRYSAKLPPYKQENGGVRRDTRLTGKTPDKGLAAPSTAIAPAAYTREWLFTLPENIAGVVEDVKGIEAVLSNHV